MLSVQLNQDLKTAMLAGDKLRVETIKGIKTALQYAEVELRSRSLPLDELTENTILQKEVKKRAESAELYTQAGEAERARKELAEKAIIETYLPKQLSDDELGQLIDSAAAAAGGLAPQNMGKLIGLIKDKAGASADGAKIARLVKEKLER